ncbi:hypothetical protein, partial [Metasolibacillus meyeri]|uniref:hypothetical protein n=1 Tax=Metasolibacillus meyeri TaxID=1071052 RepID=UPI001EE6D002
RIPKNSLISVAGGRFPRESPPSTSINECVPNKVNLQSVGFAPSPLIGSKGTQAFLQAVNPG